MPRSKESSDELRRKVVAAHEAGKGYKTIAKVYALHRSTVRQIIYKWKVFKTTATRPRSGRPTKLEQILRLMGGAAEHRPDNENETAAEDVCGSSEGSMRILNNEDRRGKDESIGISGTDTSPESTNVTAHSEVGGNILISVNSLRPDDPEGKRTKPKRRRGRTGKVKDLKPPRNRVLTSPPKPSSSRAAIVPQPDAPAEHHVEDMLCCEICGACFTTEPQLEIHQAQHLYKMLHECEECRKTFQSAAGLKTHKKRKHGC